ncbi:sigma-70 family RNA polymerase sigma factor [Streptomyces sp. MK7]|uniref:sigma-70 family RNA polymerase sigma factor n=1 Tax=Streptomyces sp. MK7 TaxID=3067635 RepID=UPI0029317CC6|nr:sigma-70 family RNA polymerase sigma factor [Streptomyces sp. MK7]
MEKEFTRFYGRIYHQLVGETVLSTRDRGQAEDAVQEALLAVLGRWSSIDHPERYVRTVLRNFVAKRAAAIPTLVPVDTVVETEASEADVAECVELRLMLVEALHGLPEQQQRATALRYLVDKSVDEVAQDLGITQSTVRVHLMQARRRIHDQWGAARDGLGDGSG